jgi:hypothetical protein
MFESAPEPSGAGGDINQPLQNPQNLLTTRVGQHDVHDFTGNPNGSNSVAVSFHD